MRQWSSTLQRWAAHARFHAGLSMVRAWKVIREAALLSVQAGVTQRTACAPVLHVAVCLNAYCASKGD